LLEGCKAVLISGKPAAGYPDGALPELARLASQAGKPLVLDLRGKDLVESLPFAPALCKPNAQELRDSYPILGFPADASLAEAAAELSKKTCSAFLITDGPRPALFAWRGKAVSMKVRSVVALNPIGSGDACAAGIALALSRGAGLKEACRAGLELGSRNATTLRPGRLPGF
jgi:fructose-1-phosphate kinase PfkB-like protein